MASKFYAVACGKSGNGMIYNTWDECKKEVIGHKGAIYKSFTSREDAINFIKLHGVEIEIEDEPENVIKTENDTDTAEIYVDGSFNTVKNNFSYGFVVVNSDNIVYEDKGIGYDKDAIALRNVSGEVLGSLNAIRYAIEKGFKKVNIYFDYQGIQSWAIGTWKRNNRITQDYHSQSQAMKKKIDINFIKVKGHSGDRFNDRADYLAKKALEES